MKGKAVLADSSALIYLAKAEGLEIGFEVLGQLRAVPAVWAEAVEVGELKDKKDAKRIRDASARGFLERISIDPETETRALDLAIEYRLDPGEAQILALAKRTELVLMDDLRGSRVARRLGLTPRSTMLLPLMGLESQVLDTIGALDLLHRLSVVTTIRADLLAGLKAAILEKR